MTLKAQFDALINENDHTGATRLVAFEIGGTLMNAYIVVLDEIAARHELNGFMMPNDSALRDSIQTDVLKTAQLMGRI